VVVSVVGVVVVAGGGGGGAHAWLLLLLTTKNSGCVCVCVLGVHLKKERATSVRACGSLLAVALRSARLGAEPQNPKLNVKRKQKKPHTDTTTTIIQTKNTTESRHATAIVASRAQSANVRALPSSPPKVHQTNTQTDTTRGQTHELANNENL
jgi:hypothetical protein